MNNGDLISRKALIEELSSLTMTITGLRAGKGVLREYMKEYRKSILQIVDESPAVDAVELPCKIGDTVWCIRNFHGHKHPQEGIVSEMLFTKEMKLHIVVKYVGCGQWGEKIFLTREEAEAAINKKEKEK